MKLFSKIIIFQVLVSFVSGKLQPPFSPSHQISESDFHPVNFELHFYTEPVRRQFDKGATTETDDSFKKLSNPYERQPVDVQTEADSLKLSNPFEFALKKDKVPPLASPPTGLNAAAKLTNVYEFVPEVIPENNFASQPVPDYIRDIKETYLLDDDDEDDEEEVRTNPHRSLPPANQVHVTQGSNVRHAIIPTAPTASQSVRQVVITPTTSSNGPNARHTTTTFSNVGQHQVQASPTLTSSNSSTGRKIFDGIVRLSQNEELPTGGNAISSTGRHHRATSNRIIFPSDRSDVIFSDVDVSNRRHYRSERQPKVSFLPPLPYYDDWIPLTAPYLPRAYQTPDLSTSQSQNKFTDIKTSQLYSPIRFPGPEQPWTLNVHGNRHTNLAGDNRLPNVISENHLGGGVNEKRLPNLINDNRLSSFINDSRLSNVVNDNNRLTNVVNDNRHTSVVFDPTIDGIHFKSLSYHNHHQQSPFSYQNSLAQSPATEKPPQYIPTFFSTTEKEIASLPGTIIDFEGTRPPPFYPYLTTSAPDNFVPHPKMGPILTTTVPVTPTPPKRRLTTRKARAKTSTTTAKSATTGSSMTTTSGDETTVDNTSNIQTSRKERKEKESVTTTTETTTSTTTTAITPFTITVTTTSAITTFTTTVTTTSAISQSTPLTTTLTISQSPPTSTTATTTYATSTSMKETVKVERDVLSQSDFWIPLTGGTTEQGVVNSLYKDAAKPIATTAATEVVASDQENVEEDVPTAQAFKMDVDALVVENLRKFLHKVHGDYESLVVLNTVPKLAGNLNLEILDDLPTLGAVTPGQVLTQDQIFIFYTTLAELHKVLEMARNQIANYAEGEQIKTLLEEVLDHNFQMLSFLLMHLVKANVENHGLVIIDSTPNSKLFFKNAQFLRSIFPFV